MDKVKEIDKEEKEKKWVNQWRKTGKEKEKEKG